MSQRTVARRYATALYQEADANDVVDAVDDDVELLRDALAENNELSRFFDSPIISPEKKTQVVESLLKEKVAPLTLQFLRMLIRKDRETMLAAMLDQYRDLRDEQLGIVDVQARVAQPLSTDDREALKEALEARTGKTVRLHVEEAPELIGGVVIRIGDRVFDGSVRNKLSTLRERFRAGTVTGNGEA